MVVCSLHLLDLLELLAVGCTGNAESTRYSYVWCFFAMVNAIANCSTSADNVNRPQDSCRSTRRHQCHHVVPYCTRPSCCCVATETELYGSTMNIILSAYQLCVLLCTTSPAVYACCVHAVCALFAAIFVGADVCT